MVVLTGDLASGARALGQAAAHLVLLVLYQVCSDKRGDEQVINMYKQNTWQVENDWCKRYSEAKSACSARKFGRRGCNVFCAVDAFSNGTHQTDVSSTSRR